MPNSLPSYRPPSTVYPPSQPAPLFLDADPDDDHDHFLNSALLSANDPDHHLRLTRSATETIHEAISEDDRRRLAKKTRLRLRNDPRKRLFPRRGSRSSAFHDHASLRKPSSLLHSSVSTLPAFCPSSSDRASSPVPPLPSSAAPRILPPMPIAPEEDRTQDEHTQNLKELEDSPAADLQRKVSPTASLERRQVYVNLVLPSVHLDRYGEPLARYVRNKVRTTKYTLITFLPKNIYEQFRNVANIYFFVLVIFQIFPIFGATTPQVAMLPLLFILSVTALKDAFEDYRRYVIDNSVNNAACTRLGDWRNVNVPRAGGGTWWENFEWPWEKNQRVVDSVGQVRKITKGVRKLREREKGVFNTDFLRASSDASKVVDNESSEMGSGDEDQDHRLSDICEGAFTSPPALSKPDGLDDPAPHPSTRATSSRNQNSSSELIDYTTPTPGTAKWERTLWKKVEVGDVILLREDEAIPADLIVLSTSDPDGQCFVETKNLDGETNLKPRRSVKATRPISNEEDVEHCHFLLDSEPPNANLYAYHAVFKYWTQDEDEGREQHFTEGRKLRKGSEKREMLGINEMLLRGCTLRNTQWVIGLVIFTGSDTKIMLNQGSTPSKKPKVSNETNYAVIVNFVVLVCLCCINAIGDGINNADSHTSAAYYEQHSGVSNVPTVNALVTFGAALILFQTIVPVSLVITLEFVRLIQALTIVGDLEMYYEPLDCPAEPKSWNLSDDLGQIEYIFSDKTGTLTQNVMEFQRCSVSGVSYGEGVTEAMRGSAKRQQTDSSAIDDPEASSAALSESKTRMIGLMTQSFNHRYLNPDSLTLISPPLIEDMMNNSSPAAREQRHHIIEFWRTLALCHDVIASRSGGNGKRARIEYKAESPDEAALVAGARDVGYVFTKRIGDRLEIEVMGQKERYQLLQTIAFNSSRKRMSTVVRCPDGRVRLLCKGADSIIMSRLGSHQDQEIKRKVNADLEAFASAGLRTLLISSREVSEEELTQFQKHYKEASDSGGKNREELMEKVADGFERGLEILGATALEDKLQVGVPEAIEKLHEAGIKLWILTGDKLQTAIEIGYSCNLLKNSMEIMIISSDTEQGARSQIEQGLEKLMSTSPLNSSSFGHDGHERVAPEGSRKMEVRQDSISTLNQSSGPKPTRPQGGYAVVIDGETLRYALDGSLKANFLALTVQCETVVCCRVSPAQKALTVKLVKDGRGSMTLAIGDGANDVAMIQEAHIGVGIAGLEGAQASMSADYALGQFRFLTRLLLVHGRWCYIRIADMHANFFFKNIIWTLGLFWYQIYCSFNGSYLYEYTFIMLFNLVFTSLPVGLMGAFEQDLSANASMAFPALYRRGILGLQYTRWKFWLYMLDGAYQSVISFWIPYFVYFSVPTVSVTGRDVSTWEFGTTIACGTVFAANNLIAINTRYFPWFITTVLVVSSMLVLVWVVLYSALESFYYKDVVLYTFSTFEFWASFILVQVLALLPRLVYKYVQVQYWPRDSDIIREIIIGRSFLERGQGLEDDIRQIKVIEQVIEKDRADREDSLKPVKMGTHKSKDYQRAPSMPSSQSPARGARPTRRTLSGTRGSNEGNDSVEMTAVQTEYSLGGGFPTISSVTADARGQMEHSRGLIPLGNDGAWVQNGHEGQASARLGLDR